MKKIALITITLITVLAMASVSLSSIISVDKVFYDYSDYEFVLDWAESILPDLLDCKEKVVYDMSDIYFRYYPNSGIYMGFYEDRLLYYQPDVSPDVYDLGPIKYYEALAMESEYYGEKPKAAIDGWYMVTVKNKVVKDPNWDIDEIDSRFFQDGRAEYYVKINDKWAYVALADEAFYKYTPSSRHLRLGEDAGYLEGYITSGTLDDFYLKGRVIEKRGLLGSEPYVVCSGTFHFVRYR